MPQSGNMWTGRKKERGIRLKANSIGFHAALYFKNDSHIRDTLMAYDCRE